MHQAKADSTAVGERAVWREDAEFSGSQHLPLQNDNDVNHTTVFWCIRAMMSDQVLKSSVIVVAMMIGHQWQMTLRRWTWLTIHTKTSLKAGVFPLAEFIGCPFRSRKCVINFKRNEIPLLMTHLVCVVVAPNLCLKLIGWHWLDLFCSSWGESSLDGLNTSADCTFFLWSHPIALVSCVVDTKVEWAIVLLGPWYCCCLTIDAGLISWSIDWCCWFIGDPIESITAGISFDIWMDGSACCCISDAAETVIVSGCLSRWKNDMIWSIRFIVCLRWSCWRWINCCISWFNLLFASRLCS